MTDEDILRFVREHGGTVFPPAASCADRWRQRVGW
jgi:hypothetical protein